MPDPSVNTESVRIQAELESAGRSRWQAYADLVIGSRRLGRLLWYEFVMLVASGVPGALGLLLRAALYPSLVGACGRGVVFGTHVVLRHPHKIRIGDNVVIDDQCLLDAKGRANEGISIGDGVFLGRNSILSCKNGDIALGRNVNIGFHSEVFSGSRVVIGDETLVAAYCYFIGGDHEAARVEQPLRAQGSRSRGIEVGSDCWIGAGVKVLDGVKVGSHCILGTGAVVTKDIPEYAVAVGVPARPVRDRRSPAPEGEERV